MLHVCTYIIKLYQSDPSLYKESCSEIKPSITWLRNNVLKHTVVPVCSHTYFIITAADHWLSFVATHNSLQLVSCKHSPATRQLSKVLVVYVSAIGSIDALCMGV